MTESSGIRLAYDKKNPKRKGGRYMQYRVDSARRWINVYESGRLVASFPIGIGRPDAPTPVGRWTITEVGPVPGDNERVALLSAPGGICLRATAQIQSLGQAHSGG